MAKKAKVIRERRAPKPAAPVQAAVVVENQVKLDLQLGMADLTNMIRTDHVDALTHERAEIVARLNTAKAAQGELEKQLRLDATALANTVKGNPKATAVRDALQAFDGRNYRVATTEESCDTDKCQVTVTIAVQKPSSYRYHDSDGFDTIVSTSENLPFTPAMHELLTKLSEGSIGIRKIQDELDDVNRRLADIPQLERRAHAALTRAHLEGKLGTGRDLLQALEAVKTFNQPLLLQDR